ncbi:MAG: 7-cyano-7-deazaguanine synthase [Acidobacteriota bacterium]
MRLVTEYMPPFYPPPASPVWSQSIEPIAVLCSGGLDSVVLVACEARVRPVQPIYVSVGLAWEGAERAILDDLEATVFAGRARRSVTLSVTMQDVYRPTHWALAGTPPAYDTPDEDVYLVGRNVVLLSKAGVYCATAGIHRIAIGPLAGNPFPDATPAFFGAMSEALSVGLAHRIRIEAPFAALGKSDVVRLGARLGVPLERSLSCMNPRGTLHCGLCSKCRERRDAFAEAGVEDRTVYAAPSPRPQP